MAGTNKTKVRMRLRVMGERCSRHRAFDAALSCRSAGGEIGNVLRRRWQWRASFSKQASKSLRISATDFPSGRTPMILKIRPGVAVPQNPPHPSPGRSFFNGKRDMLPPGHRNQQRIFPLLFKHLGKDCVVWMNLSAGTLVGVREFRTRCAARRHCYRRFRRRYRLDKSRKRLMPVSSLWHHPPATGIQTKESSNADTHVCDRAGN